MNTDGITPSIDPVADPFLAGYSAEHSIATRNLIQINRGWEDHEYHNQCDTACSYPHFPHARS